jgi:predicted CoA-binding protein
MKRTLIIGATPNTSRYANKAAFRLVNTGHKIVNIGINKGEAAGVEIERVGEVYSKIHTITLYINEKHQSEYYDYILKTKPKRLIFNPGAENKELFEIAEKAGIEAIEACTLVMLATNQY